MKQFDLQGNEYDIQIRDMIEPIENWQYVSGTRDIGKSYFQNLLNEKDKEIERLKEINKELGRDYSSANNGYLRLHSIIKEVRELLSKYNDNESNYYVPVDIALKILDKINEDK